MTRRLNIRWRLTLWFGAAMTVLLVARSFWIYFMMEQRLMALTDAELTVELDSLENEIQNASGRAGLTMALKGFADNHREVQIEVLDPDGEVLFRTPTEPAVSAKNTRTSAENRNSRRHVTRLLKDGMRCRAVTEVVSSSIGQLAIDINRSTEAEQNKSRDFVLILFTTGPGVVLAAMVVGYLVSSRALTPVDKMIAAAKEITAKRLDQRIDVPDTGDELARLAQTLNGMIDRLHKSFEEMRRFTADAAHDLRTPVAVLRTEVEVSLMSDRTVDEYRNSMQTVLDEAIQLSWLTGQLLDLSREDHGVHSLVQDQVRLDLILKSALEDLDNAAQQKRISVDTMQIQPLTIQGDHVRLRRVFINLLDNAIQYTPAGGCVWIESTYSPDWTTVVVADNGPGVPAADLPHIFDRFRRVDQARNRQSGGTGLGLAICKSIVEAHGGRVVMESTLGQGTRVIVSLPTGQPSNDAV